MVPAERRSRILVDRLHFAEGPRWHNGRLWFSDFYQHAVFTVDSGGKVERVVDVPGQPSGLGWLPDGRLLVVSMLDRRVLRLEPDGRLVVHADLSGIATYHANDMVVDRRGRAYIGNFGFDLDSYLTAVEAGRPESGARRVAASLARVDPDGAVSVAATGLEFPNGTVITDDGRTLIIAETMAYRLTAFDVAEDGTLSGRRVWADLKPSNVPPDGICLDAEGAIWTSNPLAPEVLRVGEGGTVLDRIGTSRPTFACMLGGADGRTLFIATAATSNHERAAAEQNGRIEVVEVPVPGAGLP